MHEHEHGTIATNMHVHGNEHVHVTFAQSIAHAAPARSPWRTITEMGHPAVNLDDLSSDEQLDLLEEIWERLSKHAAGVPVSEAQACRVG